MLGTSTAPPGDLNMAYTVKTLDGCATTITQDQLKRLSASIQGEVVVRGDHQYEDSRTIWNAMIDRHPGFIVRSRGASDVVTCVKFAREHGLLLTIKGGGHNIAGLAVAEGSMMLDNSLMRGVWVDTDARLAQCQSGCILGDVDHQTQVHGLAAVIGFVSQTGIAGLTLGGGFGYLSRLYGWTTDNVTEMQMVTVEGEIVRASEKENAELFWGLCGGGGNFGVLTGLTYKLYPLGPQVMAGGIAWRAEHAPAVLKMYQEITADAPRELSCVAVMRNAPPAPWLDPSVHGSPVIVIFAVYAGSVAEGKKVLAPIKAFGAPVGDIIQPRSYVSQQSILDPTQPKGRRYYWKSEYTPSIPDALVEKYIEHAGRIVSPHSAVIFFPLGGAIGDFPEDRGAVGNRDANFVFNVTASWENAADDDGNIAWARAAWSDMKKFSTGGTYLNFLTEDEGNDRLRSALRGNYDRLIDIKTQWDPTNVFRTNKNIAPR
jgi:FAD/FMN-containing dehydrogenase